MQHTLPSSNVFGRRVILVLICAFILPVGAWGQLYTGSLTGVVTDPSGAVVPDTRVVLTDIDKGYTTNTTTDSVGRYLFRNLAPSKYKIGVTSSGFRPYEQTGISIEVNQNASLNIALEMGQTGQTVEVVDTGAPLLATQDSVTGQNLGRMQINDLPLINRGVFDLAFLAPGISQPAGSSFGPNNSPNNFVSNGSRNAQADIIIDGVSTTNYEQNSGAQLALYVPAVDAIQEFKVQQSAFSAETGFSGATVMNVVFRSGTNAFHGSAYEFLRNNALDANNFFNNMAGVPLASNRRNDYGVTIGGPIRKNKTFFFADWNGLRTQSGGTNRAGVPSAAMRQGNFGEICGYNGGTFDAAGRCSSAAGQLWDPYASVYDASQGGPVRQSYIPFNNLQTYMSPGNAKLPAAYQLQPRPGNLIDPVGLKMLAYFPLPNIGVGTSQYDYHNNWIGATSGKNTNDQYDIKIDHRFSDKIQLGGRITAASGTYHGGNCFGNEADPCTQGPGDSTVHAAVLNYNHTITPTTLLAISGGMTRAWSFTHGVAADYPNFDPVKTLGLPSYLEASAIKATPALDINGYPWAGGNTAVGSQAWSYMRYGQTVSHLIGTVSHMQGRHELKFGGEFRVHEINFEQAGTPAGLETFDFNSTSQYPWSGGGDGMAGALIGASWGAWGQYEIPLQEATANKQFGSFVQDNWRVNDKLTLNLGLRYDIDMPRTERYNRQSYVDPTAPTGITAPGFTNLTGALRFVTPDNRSPYNVDYGGVGPRVGFAYRLDSKTVVRGGFGIFYSLSKAGAAGSGAGGIQGFDAITNLNGSMPGNPELPYGFLRDPWPSGIAYPIGNSEGNLSFLGLSVSGPIRTWGTRPAEDSWSFGFQRELPSQTVIDLTYVGKRGTNLYFAGAGNLNYLTEAQAAAFRKDPGYWNTQIANPFYGIITDPNSGLAAATVSRVQLALPHPQFSGVSGNDPPWGNSIYHALQVRAEKRLSRGLQFLATYTFSKSIDTSSVGGGNLTWLGGSTTGTVQDPNNLNLDRSLSQFDIPHIIQLSGTYELPFGRGKLFGKGMSSWLNTLIGGWQVNGMYRWSSGQPLILGLSGGQAIPTWGGQRPNLSATLKQAPGLNLNQYFANPEVATVPAAYTLGTAPKTVGSVRAPGTNVMSSSLFKEFALSQLREGMKFEVRLETFNTLNHPTFGAPNTTVGLSSFGLITSQANSPREVQLGMKFYF
jgi:hypothetical protein